MPRIRHLLVLLAALVLAGALAQEGQAAEEGPFDFLTLELVADGFVSPVTLTAPANDDRLFVVDRTGQVYVVGQDGTRSETPFLDIADRMVQLLEWIRSYHLLLHPELFRHVRRGKVGNSPAVAFTVPGPGDSWELEAVLWVEGGLQVRTTRPDRATASYWACGPNISALWDSPCATPPAPSRCRFNTASAPARMRPSISAWGASCSPRGSIHRTCPGHAREKWFGSVSRRAGPMSSTPEPGAVFRHVIAMGGMTMLRRTLLGLGAALTMGTAPGALAQELVVYHGWSTPAEVAALVVEGQPGVLVVGHVDVQPAVEHVRRWQGPGLLRLSIPRLCGHSSHDNQGYKSEERLAEEWARDPLPALRDYLVPALLGDDGWAELEAQVAADVTAARDAALAQPQPDPAEVTSHVWAAPQPGPAGETTPNPSDPRRINMVEAVRRTLDVELAANPRLVIFGEDVGAKGGVHTATMGLQSKYSDRRVFDTSLSEEGIIGRATGMALAGLRPAPEIQFRKYADPATEQLHNLGTLRWRTAGRFAAPVVVRMPGGFGRKVGDPWHSVTGEVEFAHAPGWRVAFPSNAEDAVGLLRMALRGDDPTIFFEHRAQMDANWARRPYPGDDFVVPFGLARRIREGDELTVVTWGAMVERCEQAARELEAEIEILDLRTIVPWDREAVLASVRKTAKCLVVHEDIELAGFGAEIAATVADEAFVYLDAPVRRLAAPPVPVPFNSGLMNAVVPSVAAIREAMDGLLAF